MKYFFKRAKFFLKCKMFFKGSKASRLSLQGIWFAKLAGYLRGDITIPGDKFFTNFILYTLVDSNYALHTGTQVSEFERDWVVGFREADWSYQRIARHLSWRDATIWWFWQEWVNHCHTQRQEGSGRPIEATEHEDWAIIRAALTVPDESLSWIAHANNASVIARTIHRRLTERGLWSRRPLHRLPLTSVQRQARLRWCQPHSPWNVTD